MEIYFTNPGEYYPYKILHPPLNHVCLKRNCIIEVDVLQKQAEHD